VFRDIGEKLGRYERFALVGLTGDHDNSSFVRHTREKIYVSGGRHEHLVEMGKPILVRLRIRDKAGLPEE